VRVVITTRTLVICATQTVIASFT